MKPMRSRHLAVWVLMLASVPAAHAGAVYKCTANGVVAFQDKPCRGTSPAPAPASRGRAVMANPADIAHLSPATLIERMRALVAQERDLGRQRDQALVDLKTRLAGEHDERVLSAEIQRYRQDWQQRFAVLRATREAVRDRLRQLCPGGASGRGGQVTCHPGNAGGEAGTRPD